MVTAVLTLALQIPSFSGSYFSAVGSSFWKEMWILRDKKGGRSWQSLAPIILNLLYKQKPIRDSQFK
jgi:hypothetical protein